MEIDIDEIRSRYPQTEWSLEMAGEKPQRCLIGRRGKFYKAFVIPPHQFFTLKGRTWDLQAAFEIDRILYEKTSSPKKRIIKK